MLKVDVKPINNVTVNYFDPVTPGLYPWDPIYPGPIIPGPIYPPLPPIPTPGYIVYPMP